jgi:L-ascorbate metabolism protein UlaG (beta-lactamase superfamily)
MSFRKFVVSAIIFAAAVSAAFAQSVDTIDTSAGPLDLHFLGHGSLMLDFAGTIVHVDPVSREADYQSLPRADMVLITHEHGDHLDPGALSAVRTSSTVVVANPSSAAKVDGARSLSNRESFTYMGIAVRAVPAYNTTEGRERFHPKGRDNGYVLTFGDTRVYIAGDTEDTPEMKALRNIDVAFLPMNQPYTMTPDQVAAAARAFRPRILYPYHYGDTDPQALVGLLAQEQDIDVRVRDLR